MRAALVGAVAGLILVGCSSGRAGDDGDATPEGTLTPTTVASTPTPTATPDVLGKAPKDTATAIAALERALGTRPGVACLDSSTLAGWRARCAEGDLDGDGRTDAAYLVPLPRVEGRSPNPGVVLVRRAAGTRFEEFPSTGEADVAEFFGITAFAVVDRTGDARPELTLLGNECWANTCASRVYVETWDGTAWRDVGPGEALESVDRGLVIEGKGKDTRFELHGGTVSTAGAGPQRAITVSYAWDGTRYGKKTESPDAPAYLYHAILDADLLLVQAKFSEAAAAYREAIDDKQLKDWKAESGQEPARDALVSYALFRVALATAAGGNDPAPALDRVIVEGKDEVFDRAAEAFRKGYLEGGTTSTGCREVTLYLSTSPDYIRQMFNYGHRNPAKTYRDICPF